MSICSEPGCQAVFDFHEGICPYHVAELKDEVARLRGLAEQEHSTLCRVDAELEKAQAGESAALETIAEYGDGWAMDRMRREEAEGEVVRLRATVSELEDALQTTEQERIDENTCLSIERDQAREEASRLRELLRAIRAALGEE